MARKDRGAFGKAKGAIVTDPTEFYIWQNQYEPIKLAGGDDDMTVQGLNTQVTDLNGLAQGQLQSAASSILQYYTFPSTITIAGGSKAPALPPTATAVVTTTQPTNPLDPTNLPKLPDGVKALKGGWIKDLKGKLKIGDYVLVSWPKSASDVFFMVLEDIQDEYIFQCTTHGVSATIPFPSTATRDVWNCTFDNTDSWVWILGGKGMKKKKKKSKPVKLDFSGMVLPPEVCQSITSILTTFSSGNRELLFERWGLNKTLEKGKGMAMLFYGVPGTGKTKCAEIIAKELGLKLKAIDMAMIWSSEPGEAERVIKATFEEATKKGDQMLLFDECEVLVANRNGAGQILAAQTNALLTSLERYEGVSVFTTNRTPQLDPAFDRRLQLKMEFPAPDFATRLKIWQTLVPKKMPLGDCVNFNHLAKSNLTGGYIKNVVLNAARRAIMAKAKKVLMVHFESALTDELNGMAAFAETDDTPRLYQPGFKATEKMEIKNANMRRELSDGRSSLSKS